ncbi:MAG: TIGR03663 family protein [Dehalococcoidia bacterium]|nr:TIGR03663 family protein [Dehalococcoidia bacterium]
MSTPIKKRVNPDRRGQGRVAKQAAPTAVGSLRPPKPDTVISMPGFLSCELVVCAAIFILGFAVRIAQLDSYPLSLGEAARALSGWQLMRGEFPISGQEPLVTLFTALSFFALGDNDFMARLAPVLIGSAMVLLPWLLRERLGNSGAIMASLFLAISPTFVFYSRTLSGEAFAAALSLGLLVCIVRYIDERRSGWAIAGAGLVALLLNAGATGLSTVLIFAVFFALLSALGNGANEYFLAWNSLRQDRHDLRQAGLVLLGVFVLVGSGFLSDVSGLQLPALSAWISEFNLIPESRPWHYHLHLLLGYEPLITACGVAAALYYTSKWDRHLGRRSLGLGGLLLFWALASLAVGAFATNKHGGQLIGSVLPLALLAGSLVGEMGKALGGIVSNWLSERPAGDARLLSPGRQTVAGLGLLLAGALFLTYALLMLADLTRKGQSVFWYQWMLVLLAVVIAVMVTTASILYGGRRFGTYAALFGLALLVAYSVHTTWRTAFAAPEDRVLASIVTSRSLVDAVAEIGDVATAKFLGKGISIVVDPDLRLPIQWYLRNYTAVQYTTSPQSSAQVIFWAVEPPPGVKIESYVARKVVLTTSWTGEADGLRGLWRWLMYDEPPDKRKDAPAMLYLLK